MVAANFDQATLRQGDEKDRNCTQAAEPISTKSYTYGSLRSKNTTS